MGTASPVGFWNSAELVGHLFMMQSLVLLLVGAVAAQNSAPPPPPDRIWFRQDSLPGGQTCADMYEGVKGTPALIQGKDPIILPEDAAFKICIKFLSGSYTNPKTGEVVERAGSVPLPRNTSPGSPPLRTAPT